MIISDVELSSRSWSIRQRINQFAKRFCENNTPHHWPSAARKLHETVAGLCRIISSYKGANVGLHSTVLPQLKTSSCIRIFQVSDVVECVDYSIIGWFADTVHCEQTNRLDRWRAVHHFKAGLCFSSVFWQVIQHYYLYSVSQQF